ncbi:MAG: GNAT family N-acetyltransferase [Flavobacteriaceae bacterium]|jgi:ElaA protein
MEIKVKVYQDLAIDELYAMMALRAAVFVVEQNCVYQDLDYKDQKALHVMGWINGKLVAYTRLFGPGDYFDQASIGRVIVSMDQRGHNYGHQIMSASINAITQHYKTDRIDISAQTYLEQFYTAHGFLPSGEEYLEDGIPHIKMIKTGNNP